MVVSCWELCIAYSRTATRGARGGGRKSVFARRLERTGVFFQRRHALCSAARLEVVSHEAKHLGLLQSRTHAARLPPALAASELLTHVHKHVAAAINLTARALSHA